MGLCSAFVKERQEQVVRLRWGCSSAWIAGMDWCQYAAAATPVAVVAAAAAEGMKEPHPAGWEPTVIGIHKTVVAPYIHQTQPQWASIGAAVAAAVFAAGRKDFRCFAGEGLDHTESADRIRWPGAAERKRSVEDRMPAVAAAAAAESLFVDTAFQRAEPSVVDSVQWNRRNRSNPQAASAFQAALAGLTLGWTECWKMALRRPTRPRRSARALPS